MEKQIEINGRDIRCQLTRKKVKNLTLRINRGVLAASVPQWMPEKQAESLILSKSGWILKALDRWQNASLREPMPPTCSPGERLCLMGRRIPLEPWSKPEICLQDDRLFGPWALWARERREQALSRWLTEEARRRFTALMEGYRPWIEKNGLSMPALALRRMKSRWGSCCPSKGRITLNLSLIHAPKDCVEYVVLHELAHLLYPDHSSRFYGVIEEVMPDYKERRRLLKEQGIL